MRATLFPSGHSMLAAVAYLTLGVVLARLASGRDAKVYFLAVLAGWPLLSETLLPAEKGDVFGLDALWSFVGSKVNARGLWITLCRHTRQVIAYFVGDRWADSARALRGLIPADYRCRASRSDFLAG